MTSIVKFDIIAHDRRNGKDEKHTVEVELDGQHAQHVRQAISPYDFVEVKMDKDGRLLAISFPKWVYEL